MGQDQATLTSSFYFRKREWATGYHSVKNVSILSFSGPYFPAFELNTEKHGVSVLIPSENGKTQTRKNPNTDIFHAFPR